MRENALVIRALMQAFGLTGLALEWPEDLAPTAGAVLAEGTPADHPLLWSGDGRITAGASCGLAGTGRSRGPGPDLVQRGHRRRGSGSQRDDARARRILAAPAGGTGTLVVAGNAHTPTTCTRPGMPLGACLAQQWPGFREVRISYGAGHYYNIQPRRFRRRIDPRRRQLRLHERRGILVLDLPAVGEAVAPQRPQP